MARSLAKVIATEKTIKADASRRISDLYKDIQKPALFAGLTRSYQPRDEAGDPLPSESTLVQLRAAEVLTAAAAALTQLFDVTLTKDDANTRARADVVVEGETVLSDVPATYLLFLEKQLTDVHTFIGALPVLDPAEQWAQAGDTYQSAVTQTVRKLKVPTPYVMYPATDKHPAQVERVDQDVPVGDWSLIKYSGAISGSRQRELLAKVTKLRLAVREAREEANRVDTGGGSPGSAIFGWLLGPTASQR